MHDGEVVQIGTPSELFETPQHTFVGHFIGSPGMNVLPCQWANGQAVFDGQPVAISNPPKSRLDGKRLEIGVRPEFVSFGEDGIPVQIAKVSDAGRYRIVDVRNGGQRINLLLGEQDSIPAENARVIFDPALTRLYADGWLVE